MTRKQTIASEATSLQELSPEALHFRARVGNAALANNWAEVLSVVREARGRRDWGGALSVDDRSSEAPLITAITEGQTLAVRAMIRAGADPDALSCGGGPLLAFACELQFLDMARCLIECGAAPEIFLPTGWTLLQREVRFDLVDFVLLLHEFGARYCGEDSLVKLASRDGALKTLRACLADAELSAPARGAGFEQVVLVARNDEVRSELLAWRSEQELAEAMQEGSEVEAPPNKPAGAMGVL